VRGRVVDHSLKSGLRGQHGSHVHRLELGGAVGPYFAGAGHERRHAEGGALSGRPFDRFLDPLVLGAWVLEVRVGAFQDRRHGCAERRREQEQDAGPDQHAARAAGAGGEGR
jgi:hypothetical protein